MTKKEKQCKDMADVCELAHERTVRECRKRGIPVDCKTVDGCADHLDVEEETHYTGRAQRIFDKHYDKIINATGL